MSIMLPRNWKSLIRRVTGMHYCDRNCGCGENNRLWWFPVGGGAVPSWMPDWMNGGDTHEIWKWLVKHRKVRKHAKCKPATRERRDAKRGGKNAT